MEAILISPGVGDKPQFAVARLSATTWKLTTASLALATSVAFPTGRSRSPKT